MDHYTNEELGHIQESLDRLNKGNALFTPETKIAWTVVLEKLISTGLKYDQIMVNSESCEEAEQPLPTAVLLHCEDWVGLYVDGKLIVQGHDIIPEDLLEYSHKYGFNWDSFKSKHITHEDDIEITQSGTLPQQLSDLKGNYGS